MQVCYNKNQDTKGVSDMNKKRKGWIVLAAAVAAVVGAVVAIAAFFRRKAKTIGDQLDYDASVYYDDEDGLAETDEAAQDGEFSEDKPEEK